MKIFVTIASWILRSCLVCGVLAGSSPVLAAIPWVIDSRKTMDFRLTDGRTTSTEAAGIVASPIVFQKFSIQGAIPLNLVEDSQGHIWFTAANSDLIPFTLGELDPVIRETTIRSSLVTIRRIHYLAVDAADRIWYLTSYASLLDPDVLGVYDPGSDRFTEWSSNQFIGLYGLAIDQQKNLAWFVGTEPTPSIFRFDIGTSTLTSWPIAGYEWAFDLSLDQNGEVWITDIPWLGDLTDSSTILHFVPAEDLLSAWPLTGLTAGPFKLSAANPDEVWLSEYQTGLNNLARLDLTTSTYEQFTIPVANSYPGGLAAEHSAIWFNAPGVFSLGKLSLPAYPDQQTVITPSEVTLAPSSPTLTSIEYDSTQFDTATSTVPFVSPQLIASTIATGFRIYPIPSTGCSIPPGGPWGHGLIFSQDQKIWLSGCSYLGRVEHARQVFLPVILKP